MFRLFFEFLFAICMCYYVLLYTITGATKHGKSKTGVKEYSPPGTVKYPLGDEQLNDNILEKPGIYDSKSVEAIYGKCKGVSGAKESHISCPQGAPGVPLDVLYSSDVEASPAVKCKKCNLKLTPDGSAVIVQCVECYDIPPPANKKMWRRSLIKIYQQQFAFAQRLRTKAEAVNVTPVDESPDVNALKTGNTVHGFEIRDVQDISVFNITAIQLQHKITKAEYLHLYRNDTNNVFSINFRTTPKDSTGLPHILEHIVLCGSKLYPARDPFFKMLNRSLATFMNAMTGSDYTIYPFSTQNYTDYCNLQKIYLDAVFRPNLKYLDFMQEGWRLENENPTDVNSKLIIKGVVYNEMKGAFSENESILMQKLQNLILPDHTYGVISGGDPIKIPNLTWEDLKKFHSEHYHPSNCRFYSYGNFPLIPTLEYLNSEYLSHYNYQPVDHTLVPSQKRWVDPKWEHIEGRFEKMREPFEKQNTLCISLAMSDVTDIYETFLIQFLTELLIRGPNSPFYKSMIEPNFSGGFTPCTGYDTQQRDSIFTIGLQGLEKEDFEKVIDLFHKTIDDVIASGFEQNHIESVLHRYELSIKHETSNFGLNLLFGLTPILNHNGNTFGALKVNELMTKLRNEMSQDPKYLQNVVEKYFKNNNHRLVLSMSPDNEYEQKQEKLEIELISEKTKVLTAEDKKNIHLKTLELLQEQNTSENTNLLPTLQMQDISNDIERTPLEKIRCGFVPTQINIVNTNGITYFKGVLNTSELSVEQQMLLPLFCYVITRMGTKQLDYREFDSLMSRKTAGLNLNIHIAESLFQLHSYEPGILLSSYCLDNNVETMWNLWQQVFTLPELKNIERFKTLVQLYMSNLTHGLADSGHVYAMQAASSLVSGSAYQRELLTGLQHITYMKRLIQTARYDSMLTEINNIVKVLFDKSKLRCCLNVSSSNKSLVYKTFEKFIEGLPSHALTKPIDNAYTSTKVWTPNDAVNCQHHVLNVPVNYCSKAILSVPYTNPDYASLRVLARLLFSKYLHPELREKQGAYGGGARITSDGVFTFYSYRDPHNLKTLDVFDNTNLWLQNNLNNITPQDLLEAKLGVFQSVDAPVPPCDKGAQEFIRGLTPDILQQHRAEIMTVDQSRLKSACEQFLGSKDTSLSGKIILGPKSDKLDISKRDHELWTVVDNE